ncbi:MULTISPECIES: aminotransferase class V-fold PLP-dependent enzyme [unclassified Wenzhouxiangella]|uniref:aminotransferase class V-fold PLP-dependent enzyme n=1 Tax=unclassified Wenzhouxiangella TaxID=2613841 RepID=UPI001C6EB28B|nr:MULTISPECIES: aminotransferase class V-fold PLP-dependent enzyme [unclassified Wenzhouxiangella]
MNPKPRPGSRALFPSLRTDVYANHASLSPPSELVRAAVDAVLAGYAEQGMAWYVEEVARRERLRESLARLIGAPADSVALTANTSAGIIAIAQGLPWQAGDRVLVFDGEFPTNITPWQQAARRYGLELVWLKADDFRVDRDAALERFEAELKRGVRLVAVSAVQFTTGQRMPLEPMGELCRRYQTELFVDAIQAAGIVPLDVETLGIDYLACGSHKWLMAPEGVGFLHVAPARASALEPNMAGWLSHEDAFAFLSRAPGELRYDRPFRAGALMAEAGTPNTLGAAGLEAGLAVLETIGIERIFEHVQAWHDALEPGLVERGFESARMNRADGRSGILSVRPEDAAQAPAWVQALADHGIACASPDGWIRFSPHWPNSLDEPGRILEAVDAIRDAGGPG